MAANELRERGESAGEGRRLADATLKSPIATWRPRLLRRNDGGAQPCSTARSPGPSLLR
jgi:hypothetical protein